MGDPFVKADLKGTSVRRFDTKKLSVPGKVLYRCSPKQLWCPNNTWLFNTRFLLYSALNPLGKEVAVHKHQHHAHS